MIYYGKYRGKVVGNRDPGGMGRIRVWVPVVLGDVTRWAMPSVPYAGPQVGLFMLPPVGANVWVDFEAGDPAHPVWSGCFWGQGELPLPESAPEVQMFKNHGASLTFSTADLGEIQRGMKLEVGAPMVEQPLSLTLNADGIEINNQSITIIKLTGEDVQVTSQGSQITVKSDSIELKNGATTVTVTSYSIDLKTDSAEVRLSPSGVSVKNGAQSVQLSDASVSVNNGALEVI